MSTTINSNLNTLNSLRFDNEGDFNGTVSRIREELEELSATNPQNHSDEARVLNDIIRTASFRLLKSSQNQAKQIILFKGVVDKICEFKSENAL